MYFFILFKISVLITVLITVFAEYGSASFLPDDFTCWFSQGSVVANDWLYIASGEIYTPISSKPVFTAVNFTLSIDLRVPWTTKNVAPVVTPQLTGTRMQSRNPTMWYDRINDKVYWYGGEPYYKDKNNFPTAWGFTPDRIGSVGWESKYTAGIGKISEQEESFSGFTELCGSAYAFTTTAYYALGGYIAYANDPAVAGIGGYRPAITGLVSYDFQHRTWSNSSTIGMASHERGFSVQGQAVYVPVFGKEGVIIFIGGDAPTSHDWFPGSSSVSMTEITIFDIYSGKYYSQQATGPEIPIQRGLFCAVGVGPTDSTTWEIFVYGGKRSGHWNQTLDPDTLPDLSAVYILTLPAFEWIKTPANTTHRLNHRCEVIGKRQMLSIGGLIENNVTLKDPWPSGLGIFDMSELTWKTEYSPDAAPYASPSIVKAHYGKPSKGYPQAWGDPDLVSIFKVPGNATRTAPSNATSPTNTTIFPSQPIESPKSSETPGWPSTFNTKAIIGISIGGTSGVILAILVALWKNSKRARFLITKFLQYIHLMPLPPPELKSLESASGGSFGAEVEGLPIWEVDGKHRYLEMDGGFRAEMSEQHGGSELRNTSPMARRFSNFVMANGSLVELPVDTAEEEVVPGMENRI